MHTLITTVLGHIHPLIIFHQMNLKRDEMKALISGINSWKRGKRRRKRY
jgi:hypothetical protein